MSHIAASEAQCIELSENTQLNPVGDNCVLIGYAILFGDSGQPKVRFRNGDITGDVLWNHSHAPMSAARESTETHDFSVPVMFSNGLFVEMVGDGTHVCVQWAPVNG